jgi:glutathione S-transferase
MQLIGMLDSPYVRRCAIAGTLLGLRFEHHSVSVFRHMPRFATFNPLYKAPSLVADDGTVLMDSSLILQHFEDVAARSLRPVGAKARLHDLRMTGLGIVAADKAVAVEYERKRPEAMRSPDWSKRIEAQLHDALALIEAEPDFGEDTTTPGAVICAVAWGFVRYVIPTYVAQDAYPKVAAHAARCEASAHFKAWPIDRE